MLDRPGAWRAAALLPFVALAAPALSLFVAALAMPSATWLGAGYGAALLTSVQVAVAVAAISLALGLPAGLLSACYRFRGRRLLLALLALPLLMPSFLWAIGLAMLRAALGWSPGGLLSGATAGVLACSALGVPLVLFATLLAVSLVTQGQADAARLAGGETILLRYATHSAAWPATAAAVFAALLSLADPGPGQILGYATAAGEVLVSFAAFYDFDLAARQSLALTAIALAITIPLFGMLAPRVEASLLSRDTKPASRRSHPVAGILIPFALTLLVSIVLLLPVTGLLLPLGHGVPVIRAAEEVSRTILDTIVYALGAGLLATGLGFAIATVVARNRSLRNLAIVSSLTLLALPPALTALGILLYGATAPAALDWLLRSRLTVCVALAARFVPIAVLLGLVSAAAMSHSWTQAAAVHGVGLRSYLRTVSLPSMQRGASLSVVLVALLATAETGTVLLLRPPGADSLPVAIFTVMANAPETLVAALCLAYLGGAVLVLVASRAVFMRGRP